jgi:hypothetical protein
MTDVTAEMIALGHVTGLPKVVDALPPRYVKPARSQPGLLMSECGFEVELLRLLAKGRKSAVPALTALALLAAAVATNWISWKAALI